MSVAEAPQFTPRQPVVYRRFDPSRVVGRMSPEEYIAFERRGEIRYEYIEGSVVAMAGGSLEHSLIAMNAMAELRAALISLDAECFVYGSDQKVRINSRLYRYPDGTIVCGKPLVDPLDALQNPVVIVEVLSPSTEHEDRTNKFRNYQRIESLQHYILIDQFSPGVTHYEKNESGQWVVAGIYVDLTEVLTLTLDGKNISVPLSAIYRQIEFAAEETTTAQNEE